MTKLPTPKGEGDKMTCPDCRESLVARLKTYKDNSFPAYIQWQNANETKAHKTKDGNCKGKTLESLSPLEFTKTLDPTITQESIVETTNIDLSNINEISLKNKIIAIDLKVEKMFAMISEQYADYQERKNQQ